MKHWPLRFHPFRQSRDLIFTSDAGDFFRAPPEFLERHSAGRPSEADEAFLTDMGLAFKDEGDLAFTGFAARWARRLHVPAAVSYVILVPTLRCDLDCSYCQVSRVAKEASGFDWSEETLAAVLRWLDGLQTESLKVEFQGGEPLLRLDLLARVREFCRARFQNTQFVVCTNLQNVDAEAWAFLSAEDTFISTSFDGTVEAHTRQRTKSGAGTATLMSNIWEAIARFGPDKVSALPTIDMDDPPDPEEMLRGFVELGFTSIFLRKVNHQGFARKRHDAKARTGEWLAYHRAFVEKVIAHNATQSAAVEEYYIAHILRRILQGGHNGHTDLRNPSWLGRDMILVDFDGAFYPTDEARMLKRMGVIDLSIGSVFDGVRAETLEMLQGVSYNGTDPDCAHCAFQPYCGADPVDDISRYGRLDVPRHLTEHCRLHSGLFEFAFELLYADDPATRSSVARWLGVSELPPFVTPSL